jgi:hypothetical protein
MKIHFVILRPEAMPGMMEIFNRARPQIHTLTDDAAAADMILFIGKCDPYGRGIVDNPLVYTYPEKCFIYWDDDGFIPLLPGIYTNAEKPGLIDLHRATSQMWVVALNPNIQPIAAVKKYLFSFAGGSTSLLRKKLYKVKFKRSDVLVQNTSDYYHWDPSQAGRDARQKQYATTIAESHFGLSPRGASAGSLRLFEIMEMGVAPVLVADSFLLPEGPDWNRFLIRVPERKVADLDTILAARVGESAEMGRRAREAWDLWFAPDVRFNRIIEACVSFRDRRRIPERFIHPFWGYMLWRKRLKGSLRTIARNAVLKTFKFLHIPFMYDLNKR